MPSIWEKSVVHSGRASSPLHSDIKTDVLIIGGGMAGILCAHQLTASGLSCIVVEAKQIGSGTTHNTTAKITPQHGLIYAKLIRSLGAESAGQYYKINNKAVEAFRTLAKDVPCDFMPATAYIYSRQNRKKLEDEAAAYAKLKIPFLLKEKCPLPFPTVGALGMKDCAQFHPLKLLLGLAGNLTIYENTFIREIDGNRAVTSHGSITAKHIILATHYPLINIPGLYFVKLYQHRSYVLALENAVQLDGMYLDEDNSGFSFRNYQDQLLLGGGSHRTGKKGGDFKVLRDLAKQSYPLATETCAWATQDCMSLDGIPYIGIHRKSTPHLYVATGFNKWGMTGSMAAAITLRDLIVTGRSNYAALFSPQRSLMHPQLFLNLWSAVSGLLQWGRRCSHMGCSLKWNPQEKTWDCPCHGSRFDPNGHVINNPAKRGIKRA